MTKFVSMQNFYNLVYREEEREMLPLCRDAGHRRHSLEPAGARLPGPQRRPCAGQGIHPRQKRQCAGPEIRRCRFEILKRVEETGKKHGKSNAQIATAWLLAKGVTAPIVGASKMSHLEDAIAAAEIKLTADEVKYLEEPYQPKAVAGKLR